MRSVLLLAFTLSCLAASGCDSGSDGADGSRGPAGEDGENGQDGPMGAQGIPGEPGLVGAFHGVSQQSTAIDDTSPTGVTATAMQSQLTPLAAGLDFTMTVYAQVQDSTTFAPATPDTSGEVIFDIVWIFGHPNDSALSDQIAAGTATIDVDATSDVHTVELTGTIPNSAILFNRIGAGLRLSSSAAVLGAGRHLQLVTVASPGQ